MNNAIARRRFLQTALVAAVAFNPVTRVWATEPEVDAEPERGADTIPSLDGQIYLDTATRTAAADDFGHIVHHGPVAVLVPGSVHDIRKMVKFARKHGLWLQGSAVLARATARTVRRKSTRASLSTCPHSMKSSLISAANDIPSGRSISHKPIGKRTSMALGVISSRRKTTTIPTMS